MAAITSTLPISLSSPPSPPPPHRRSTLTINSFSGMKADCSITRLGLAPTADSGFAKATIKARVSASSGRGAMGASCNIASEIFRVVPIISGLVLTGIALGFVLLRVEAAVEEAESE